MRITGIETRRYVFPFEPPLRVAWDPVPRTQQEATVAIVRSDEGLEGCCSGDALPDRELLERLLVGVDPLRTEIVRELCETVDFHHGRPWTSSRRLLKTDSRGCHKDHRESNVRQWKLGSAYPSPRSSAGYRNRSCMSCGFSSAMRF